MLTLIAISFGEEMRISPEITCFVFCRNEVSGEIENQLADTLKIGLRQIDVLDDTLANRFLLTKNGCIVISCENDTDIASDLTKLFLRHHVWLPVVSFVSAKEQVRHRAGVFAIAQGLDALKRQVVEAIKCDVSGGYPPADLRQKIRRLTPREKEAMDLFLIGLNTKAVAKTLGITYQTVDKHRGRALRKFAVPTVVDLQITIQRTMLESMGISLAEPTPSQLTSRREPPQQAFVPNPHFTVLGTSPAYEGE